MKILERVSSRELCSEAGWYAFDFYLEREMDDAFIRSLSPLGSFLYLPLAKPFFKIESENYLLKGLKHDTFFRMAVHGDSLCELDRVHRFIEDLS